VSVATLRAKHAALRAVFTERSRRLWAATEARALGYGGIAAVARATSLSPATISRGLTELDQPDAPLPANRVRKAGAGRKRATTHQPTLLRDLDALVEPTTPGDPDSPLRWTCLSTRTLAVALEALGHRVSHTVVAALLHGLGYSLQGTGIGSRPSRLIPRRRSWSAPSRTAAVPGARRRRLSACASTTSSFRVPPGARPFPTASTICIATRAG
jgi:hypothetical protein